MDKETRNAIERATQRARELLKKDFAAQLEGDFDVLEDGTVAAKEGGHLSTRQAFQRERIVAAIEHKRAAGMNAADSVADYLRDAAFTTLNRFVALKMLEARDLVQECITKGEQSAGYRESCGMAPGLPLLPDSAGYRLYIESLFDELSTEVKVLFDRRDPSTVLWPKRTTFEQLLQILNAGELVRVWGEDETIGWVYQFFNGQDERRKMREESQAPRNSRELAVRNQFFTPRYIVQFLTDNTLGRIWYEMRGTKTLLAEQCEYMVRKPDEEFAPRTKKDPRDLRVLDPACGSGHFLLYAFDLLLAIYEEAHADLESPRSEATGKTLAEDYPSLDALRKAIPGLVLAHNIHGVDIDPRCAQIAQLALWMRAQKAYRDFGIGRAERAQIRRSNIVVAEPLVADEQIAKEFVAKLGDAELGRVFISLVEALSLAGDLGLLLRVETLVARPSKRNETEDLFTPTEARLRAALARFVTETSGRLSTSRRLFADDATHGLSLLEIAVKQFDVVLMNPPFGLGTARAMAYVAEIYKGAHNDLFAAFASRGASLLTNDGCLGAITTRSFLVARRLETFRRSTFLPTVALLLDLGAAVMDGAFVESCAWVLHRRNNVQALRVCDLRKGNTDPRHASAWRGVSRERFDSIPFAQVLYSLPDRLVELLRIGPHYEPAGGTAREGMKPFENDRFLRLWWEVPKDRMGWNRTWRSYAKGGPFRHFLGELDLVINWADNGRELCAVNMLRNGSTAQVRQASTYWGKPGVTYSRRSAAGFSARALPAGVVFSDSGPAIIPADSSNLLYTLGFLNSRMCRALIQMQANASKFMTGIIKTLPWIEPDHTQRELMTVACDAALRSVLLAESANERSSFFAGPFVCETVADGVVATIRVRKAAEASVLNALRVADEIVDQIYGLSSDWTDDVLNVKGEDEDEDEDEDDRPSAKSEALPEKRYAYDLLFWSMGVALGRFTSAALPEQERHLSAADAFKEICSRALYLGRDGGQKAKILVDDPGDARDVERVLSDICRTAFGRGGDEAFVDIERALGCTVGEWCRKFAFDIHLQRYSSSRRKAPIYWQLTTPSGRYSIWLFVHALTNDSLYEVQERVLRKREHEAARLESLRRECGHKPTPVQQREIAVHEAFVMELGDLHSQAKLVAPLWKLNLDDGVINFAPLWRLVPQNKSWQKELKSTWDALGEGKYDWAHLAMHLWPERVVPKCAKDRSLAIAHGLEDMFWVEGSDGKWTERKTPMRSIDELVRERTSPAVKSALKSLLEAPSAVAAAKKTKRGKANA